MPPDSKRHSEAPREILGYVRVEQDHLWSVRTLVGIKSFLKGEIVLREKHVMCSNVDGDLQRLTAYMAMDNPSRAMLFDCFSEVELRERGCIKEPGDIQGVLKELESEGLPLSISMREAAAVLARWAYTAHVSKIRIYRHISTMQHSCAAALSFTYDEDTDMGLVTARCEIAARQRIGAWLLPDVEPFWKSAHIRSKKLVEAHIIRKPCVCARCLSDDTCRAIRCPSCKDYFKRLGATRIMLHLSDTALLTAAFVGWRGVKLKNHGEVEMEGEIIRNGKLKRWRCKVCDFDARDDAAEPFTRQEAELVDANVDVCELSEDSFVTFVL